MAGRFLNTKKSIRTPWSYRRGSSPLHRLPAGCKLTFLLFLSLAAFFPKPGIKSLAVLSGIALILIVLSFIANIKPWELLRGSGPLFFMVLGVFLLRGIEISPPGFRLEGLLESGIFCLRIGAAFAAANLLFAVTTTGEIRKSFSRLETALHLEKLKPGLSISLMMGFLPLFFEIWENVNLAWKSRGGRKNLLHLTVLIPLALERMMVKAAETASALESRASNKSNCK